MILTESRENCLEEIYRLSQTRRIVRNVDLATSMKKSKPTITVMMKALIRDGYVTVEESYGHLALTPAGLEIAKQTYARHQFYKGLLLRAGVDPESAEEEGCALEHVLTQEAQQKLERYIQKLEQEK